MEWSARGKKRHLQTRIWKRKVRILKKSPRKWNGTRTKTLNKSIFKFLQRSNRKIKIKIKFRIIRNNTKIGEKRNRLKTNKKMDRNDLRIKDYVFR